MNNKEYADKVLRIAFSITSIASRIKNAKSFRDMSSAELELKSEIFKMQKLGSYKLELQPEYNFDLR